MELLVHIAGFLGGWLLVAGPLYQASIELDEEALDRDEWGKVHAALPQPERISPWWWLLPPVAYLKQRRASKAYQAAVLRSLTPQQLSDSVAFVSKARGWFIVAAGASLIAFKETWELVHLLEWHVAVFWVLVVVMPVLCIGHTVISAKRKRRLLAVDQRTSNAASPSAVVSTTIDPSPPASE